MEILVSLSGPKTIMSLGTATSIAQFLFSIDQVKLQRLNKRMYHQILPQILFIVRQTQPSDFILQRENKFYFYRSSTHEADSESTVQLILDLTLEDNHIKRQVSAETLGIADIFGFKLCS